MHPISDDYLDTVYEFGKFKLLQEEFIEFSKLGLRDNVAQICVFESMKLNDNNYASALPGSSAGSNRVVICNIHVLYNPKRGEIKLGQIRVLLDRAYAVSKLWDDAPVVLCGDFNCTPKSPLYNFISEQKLDLSELPRDKISGQASAVIGPPRPFISNFREPRQNYSPIDMQKQNGLGCSSETVHFSSSSSSLSQPECLGAVGNMSASSCINRQHENVNSALSDEPTEETHQGRQDGCEDETESVHNVSVCDQKESPIIYHDGGRCSVDPMKDGVDEFTPVDSHHEDSYPDDNQMDHGADIHDASNSSCNLSIELSLSNLNSEDASLNSEKGKLCFEGDNYSADAISDHGPVSTIKSDVSLSNVLLETSFPGVPEECPIGSSRNLSSFPDTNEEACPSTSYEDDIALKSACINSLVDEKMENLSLSELVEATKEHGTPGEDCTVFLSELHNTNGGFPSAFGQFPRSDSVECNESSEACLALPGGQLLDDYPGIDSEPFNVEKTPYDPSAWTPMEIETASGSSDCTYLDHPLQLRSTYAEVEDLSGRRDSNGEPLVTSYNRCFLGTVDYIWRSEGLQTIRVLAPMAKHTMLWTPGFPTKKWGSDHIALVSELAFTKDAITENEEVR
ncbi:unnamed protein product [Ilex paraguariensis]|uniref:Endonuclease/exonuclease/phosphatase domain-containing protein n=1 Tax=Ilex paraguariensis TaxID=185542 RepID=A0ABC8U3H7_9AQUA